MQVLYRVIKEGISGLGATFNLDESISPIFGGILFGDDFEIDLHYTSYKLSSASDVTCTSKELAA